MLAALAALRLPVLPRWAWQAVAALIALGLVWHWHQGRVAAAARTARTEQAAADRAAYDRASRAAAAAQTALANRLATRQASITKGTDHALRRQHDDLARRYDALRLRWAAHTAAEGATGDDHATAVSGTARRADAADCAAAGWVSFDTAAAAAEAADRAIAKDDAWIAWASAQAAAWPK